MSLKNRVGEKSEVCRVDASAERILKFCEAVGAPPSSEAPPTFMTICRDGEFALISKLGLPLSRVLHAEQEYQYKGKICAGDEVVAQAQLTNVLEKNGASGSMSFMTFETQVNVLRGGSPELVGLSKTTIVVRS